MKKVTNSLILGSIIIISTGCVSDTLALISPKNGDTQTLALANNTGEHQLTSKENSSSETKTSKVDEKMKELDTKAEGKFDKFIDRIFNKL